MPNYTVDSIVIDQRIYIPHPTPLLPKKKKEKRGHFKGLHLESHFHYYIKITKRIIYLKMYT